MAKQTTKTSHEEEPEEEYSNLVYEIKTNGGDVYLTINAGRNSDVRVMSGQPQPPPVPPKP